VRSDVEQDALLDNHDRRINVLEGRIGSYADAELAYRQAESALKRMHDEHVNANQLMLSAAKGILDRSVSAAVQQFKEPLGVVDDIRKAQLERHAREQVIAEQGAENDRAWLRFKIRAGVVTASILVAVQLYRMWRGM
jgi:hypothetical protein